MEMDDMQGHMEGDMDGMEGRSYGSQGMVSYNFLMQNS